MHGLTIVLLLFLIALTLHTRMPSSKCIRRVYIFPMGSFNDIKGKKIPGKGLTPLTTPCKRTCAQLLSGRQQQEVSPVEPTKL